MAKMKILYVITDLTLGGAQIQLLRICKYISENTNNQIFLVSLLKPTSEDVKNIIVSYGIKYFTLDMHRGKATIGDYRSFIKLVRRIRPNVIHAHMVHANFLSRAARPLLGKVKIINTIHGEEEFIGKRKQIYKITDTFAEYTVACGYMLYEQAREYGISCEKRLKYICNGLDINEYKFNKAARDSVRKDYNFEDFFVWMTVARLSEVKNQRYLIKEFKYIYDNFIKVKLVLVGDGSLCGELKKLVKEQQMENNVLFMGSRDDVKRLLCAADAFVLASLHEGLPLSLQEAGAIGMPLVSTNVGGCSEIIKEGYNGFLCDSNKPKALSVAMKKVMICDKEELKGMGIKSRKIITEKYNMSNVMKQWGELYEN